MNTFSLAATGARGRGTQPPHWPRRAFPPKPEWGDVRNSILSGGGSHLARSLLLGLPLTRRLGASPRAYHLEQFGRLLVCSDHGTSSPVGGHGSCLPAVWSRAHMELEWSFTMCRSSRVSTHLKQVVHCRGLKMLCSEQGERVVQKLPSELNFTGHPAKAQLTVGGAVLQSQTSQEWAQKMGDWQRMWARVSYFH